MKKSIYLITMALPCLMLATLLSACNWSDPVRVEEDFGNSVRHMIKQQTQSSEVKTHQTPVAKVDGETVVNSLETYRKNQKTPSEGGTLDQLLIGN